MTWEFARHVQPERTMIIDMHGGGGYTKLRGPNHLEAYRWGDVKVNFGHNSYIAEKTVRDFCTGLDVVYAAEWFYRQDFCDIARECGARTVLHAMPEMWHAEDAPPDVVWAPTGWELGHKDHTMRQLMPADAHVVPVPIPTDTFTPRPRVGGAVLHLASPAFKDRNGSDLVAQAVRWMDYDVKVIWAADVEHPPPARPLTIRGRMVDIEWRHEAQVDRRDVYPAEAGILLLPRRFGGLSLPMQEVAALGWPIVTTNLTPQNEWVHPDTLVEPMACDPVKMVGGWFDIYSCNPRQLAFRVERLLNDADLYEQASETSLAHARRLSWDVWTDRYRQLLEEAVEAPPAGTHTTNRLDRPTLGRSRA
jgi:hypothetical protein